MQVTNTVSSYFTTSDGNPTAAQIQKTDSAFAAFLSGSNDSPQTILADITSGGATGLLKWQVKQMQQQITAQVLSEKNLTADKIAAMPAKQRIATEQQIMREVAQRLKQAINEAMKKQNPKAFAFGDLMDSTTVAATDAASLNMVV